MPAKTRQTRPAATAKKAAPTKGRKTAKATKPAAKAATRSRREITPEAVQTAIDLRSEGATWSAVIEATGFNGALLRPHMKRAGFDPEAVAPTVGPKATAKAIAADRKRGVALYALAKATGKTEADIRKALDSEGVPSKGRVFAARPDRAAKAAKATKAIAKAAKSTGPKQGATTADRRKAARARAAKAAK